MNRAMKISNPLIYWVLPGPQRMLAGSARHFPSDNLKKAISFRFERGGNPL